MLRSSGGVVKQAVWTVSVARHMPAEIAHDLSALQAVRVAGIRTGQTGEDEGTNCGTCNAPAGSPGQLRVGAECLDELNSTKRECHCLALFETWEHP
jgi:hypothetical protein